MVLVRKLWLAAYLLVTGAGALTLDPILKSLVGRLRPVVAHPIAHGTGDSFPSGPSGRARMAWPVWKRARSSASARAEL